MLCAAAMLTASVSAQTVLESKTFDNIYIGVNGGVATKMTHSAWMKNLNPNAGIRIGRYFTPVVGLAIDGNAYFSNKPGKSIGTFVRYSTVDLLGTVNFSNWFGGYPGEPRGFEVIAVGGLGWGHWYGNKSAKLGQLVNNSQQNDLTAKVGLDFAFNFGSTKAWQFYLEPAVLWGVNGDVDASNLKLDANRAHVQLNAGIIYKFKNSHDTHNFVIAELRDQAEIDGLNAQINSLRGDLSDKDALLNAKDQKIADLQKALDDCNNKPKYVKPETATNLQPTVLFRQGKSVIDPAQYAPIELIATYMKNHPDAKIMIKGYASPEGSTELNQKLSEDRAAAVKNALVKKYKISADRLETKGCGETDKLFEQVEFNRVATFNDEAR